MALSPRVTMIALSVLAPPLAVGLRKGAGNEFLVCVVLTLCAWVPGVVYALWVLRSA
jgi:uncharacterized membrane protein YqaE (UPF0057 family)